MTFELKTPKAHQFHELSNCGCATTVEEVYFKCKECGAHYTAEPLSFVTAWFCYDCNKKVVLLPVQKSEKV